MVRVAAFTALVVLASVFSQESVLTLSAKRKHRLDEAPAPPGPVAAAPLVPPAPPPPGPIDWASQKAQLQAWVVGPERKPMAVLLLEVDIMVLDQTCRRLRTGATAGPLPLEVRDAVKSMYLRGYHMKETQPKSAIKAFRLVTTCLPSGDRTYLQALMRLKELER